MGDDLISRKAAIEALGERPTVWNEWTNEYALGQRNQYDADQLAIETVPSAQQWIPVKYRPMTEEERAYWSDILGYDCEYNFGDNMMFDCQMPDDGQKILVCSKCGNIWIDTNEDDGGLMGLEGNGDWEGIVAWMPLPEPYKEEV